MRGECRQRLTPENDEMNHTQNPFLALSIDLHSGAFTIEPSDSDFPAIRKAQLVITVKSDERHFQIPLTLREDTAHETAEKPRTSSRRAVITFHLSSPIPGLDVQVLFSIPFNQPAIFWKVKILNQGSTPLHIERIDLVRRPSGSKSPCLRVNGSPDALSFYVNGWQSWSFSALTSRLEPQMRSRLGFLQNPMIVNASLRRAGSFASLADMYAVLFNRDKEKGCLLGFLSQKEQFGHIALTAWKDADVCMWADADSVRLDEQTELQTDWATFMLVEGLDNSSIDLYLDEVARENAVAFQKKVFTGWCSWYQYYHDISRETIGENLKVLVDHRQDFPLDLVQIDDGFQTKVGDWFSFTAGFPQGVLPLARDIQQNGFLPGLWLAPFIVDRSSSLFRDHPDWILRKATGSPVNAGFGWNALTTALDLTQPAASDYVREVISTAVGDWQYPYLKLDFLYAAALKGKYYDPTKTRAQVLRAGLETIRTAAGQQIYLVGCGLPIGSGIGLVDSMRVGPDVAGSWVPKFEDVKIRFTREPSVPSARNSLRNILSRANLHDRWWVNDPDCVLVRDQSELTLPEVQTLATVVAMSGGSMIFSDDLTALSDERLWLASRLLPPVTDRLLVLDWLQHQYPHRLRMNLRGPAGDWVLLAHINWLDATIPLSLSCSAFGLADGNYWISDFWAKKIHKNTDLSSLGEFVVPAHGCALLAVRPVQRGEQYLGSDLHFSQGKEVAKWSSRRPATRFTLDAGRHTSGSIFLSLPRAPKNITSSGDILNCTMLQQGVYELQVQLEQPQTITITH